MAHNEREISNHDGQPVRLYQFVWGSKVWYYTSADEDIDYDFGGVIGVKTFVAVSCRDNGMTQGGSSQNDFQIMIQSDLELVQLFRLHAPSKRIAIFVRTLHSGETEAPVDWVGVIGNVVNREDAEATVIGRTLMSTLKKTALRLKWEGGCNHYIYDRGCKVVQAEHQYSRTVEAISGNVVTFVAEAGPALGFFDGGIIEWIHGGDSGVIERRGIEGSTADNVLLIYGRADSLTVGDLIDIYPGCAQTPEVCQTKFDNLPNYGGMDFLPKKSPFDGTQVF